MFTLPHSAIVAVATTCHMYAFAYLLCQQVRSRWAGLVVHCRVRRATAHGLAGRVHPGSICWLEEDGSALAVSGCSRRPAGLIELNLWVQNGVWVPNA